MPVDSLDKPIAKLREETIDQLILNYSHGELSLESFERRLDQALDAETHDALLTLTTDLDLVVDSAFMEQKKREFGFMSDSHDVMSEEKIVSIFGNSKREGVWDVPKEIRVFSIFGNSILDFSEARFTSMTTHINVSSAFGNTIIYIPEDIKIVSYVSCVFGGAWKILHTKNRKTCMMCARFLISANFAHILATLNHKSLDATIAVLLPLCNSQCGLVKLLAMFSNSLEKVNALRSA